MPRQTPEPDQTMAAPVLVKPNASGDFGRLLAAACIVAEGSHVDGTAALERGRA